MDRDSNYYLALQKILYKEIIRITLLVNPNVTEPQIFGRMSALVRKAKNEVNGITVAEKIDQLLNLVYHQWGFLCDYEAYYYSQSLMMNSVLQLRKGMPVSIGAIILYLAAILKLPLYPVNFPTQLIIRAEIPDKNNRCVVKFINPWNGQFVSYPILEKWLEGEMGFEAELNHSVLKIAEMDELIERVETVFKMALSREANYEAALRLIESRLVFSPEDPYEIRDRGVILASMACYHAALEDISYFIDQCPEDPSALMLKLELPALERQSRLCSIH